MNRGLIYWGKEGKACRERDFSLGFHRGGRRQAHAEAICAQGLPFPHLPVGIYSLRSKLPSLVSSDLHSFSNTPALRSGKRLLLLPCAESPPSEQLPRLMPRLGGALSLPRGQIIRRTRAGA